MNKWKIYRAALHLLPARKEACSAGMMPDLKKILIRYRAMGASICLFDAEGIRERYLYGRASKTQPVTRDTRFRTASVSKHVTALGAMKLKEEGRVQIDSDVSEALGFLLRHPAAPDTPITLRMLLSHVAGIHDGESYLKGIRERAPLSQILLGDSFTSFQPGQCWEYSNLGGGIIGSVLEGLTGTNFDTLMKQTLFDPLGITASYYPQRLGRPLADAWRILPPSAHPKYDAEEHLSRSLPEDRPDPEHHWLLAHGNLCITAEDLAVIGRALMCPGFLRAETLEEMRSAAARFGKRAPDLSEGIGTFILKNKSISDHVIYGHQGLAYGAVHGLFYDPIAERGFAMLSTGISEARNGVLTDVNADLIRLLIG